MTILQQLQDEYDKKDCRDLGARQLQLLRDRLKKVQLNEIKSAENGRKYIELLKKFREAVAENDKLHGENYPQLLNSLLSVGEDGLYSNSLRFIFELIQNVDDCDYSNPSDCKLDMQFDFENNKIILTYNETGFTPFNVFAITGIAEAANYNLARPLTASQMFHQRKIKSEKKALDLSLYLVWLIKYRLKAAGFLLNCIRKILQFLFLSILIIILIVTAHR